VKHIVCLPVLVCVLLPCRTLDLYTSAVLEAVLDPPSGPKPEWREMMMQLSRDSCEVSGGGGCGAGGGGCVCVLKMVMHIERQ
jgi:hypothetical protein